MVQIEPELHGAFYLLQSMRLHGGEPIHEPAERLLRATVERQLEDRVRILHEGESAVY